MSNKKTAKIVSIMLAILMVFGGMFSPISELGVSKVYAATKTVSTWAELKEAVNDSSVVTISITGDIFANGETVTIDRPITLNGAGTIYRGRKDGMDSLFKVTNGGSLTIAGTVTLSGKEYTCTGASVLQVPGVVTKIDPTVPTNLDDPTYQKTGDATGPTVSAPFEIQDSSSLGIGTGYKFVPGGPTTLSVVSGKLKADSHNMYVVYTWQKGFGLNLNPDDSLELRTTTGDPVTTIEDNIQYVLFTNAGGGSYIYHDGTQYQYDNTAAANADKNLKVTGSAGGAGSTYWEIPDENGNPVQYNDSNEAQAALTAYLNRLTKWKVSRKGNDTISEECPTEDDANSKKTQAPYAYWIINSDDSIKYESEQAANEAAAQSGCSPNQGCDNFNPITATQFNGTSMDAPKGFFIQVENGGKATLNGGTLSDFVTSRDKGTTPKFVAPVAVVGGTFDIVSGEIKNNIVGYIVSDNKANENANAIKMYVKGAAPNAVRASGERRNAQAGIDGGQACSGITATAGAVIYTKGAQGTVSGGTISMNRGDTGGIMASGANTNVTLASGTNINNNVGVQFGGGTTTENGAWILMTGGTIKENVAWFGGGAVYSTENGVDWLLGNQSKADRQDGWFTMDGGTIERNTAFTRGGAILADSDGVSLIKGTFKDNMARMLGGAIYVMGDHPDYTYTVYIEKGYVHENKAVSGGYKGTNPQSPDASIDKESNLKLSRKLVGTNGCNPVDKLFADNDYMTTNSDDTVDGYPGNQKDSTDGTGGGVWLCSFGNTTLDLSDASEFYINENTATGSVRHQPISGPGKGGDDLHKDTKNNGSLVITGIDANDNWVDQNSGEKYTSPDGATNSINDTAMRNLINNGNDKPAGYDPATYNGVDFYGNLSRRGGALAADGSFVFGKRQNLAQLFAEMSIKKAWTAGTTKQPIVLKIFVETADDKVEFAEVPLTQEGALASELDTTFDDGDFNGRIMLPAFVEKRDESDKIVDMIPVFDIKVDGTIIDLNSVDDLTKLAEAIADNKDRVEFSSEGRKITFEEYIEVGGELVKTDQFQLSPAKISLEDLDATIKVVKQKQTDGSEKDVVKASFPELKFNANISNDKPAEIEKFVNEAVHKNISLDEVFTYDIVAYVKQDADKIVITDTLVDDLEFVSSALDVKLYDIGTENNHKVTNNIVSEKINDDASVSGGTEIVNEEVVIDGQALKKVEIKDQTLTVTLANLLEFDADGNYQKNADDNQILTPLRGHWVRVSFQAQIKKEYQDKINAGTMKISDLQNVTIKAADVFKPENSIFGEDENRPTPNIGNKPVESDEDHNGIINTASYEVSVANEATYKDESNTVTVKPQEPEVEKYVSNAVHKEIELGEEFEYEIIGFITKDADKVIFEDELVPDLEFTDEPNVKVSSLDTNNHLPQNDIYGIEVNENATVAKEGSDITNEKGVTITTENGKLIVTIDDEVKVNEGTGAVTRERELVKGLRGKYVKVTFNARIKKSIQDDIANGKKTVSDLANVTVKADENKPVLSDEDHNGIDNQAKMSIYVGNEGKYNLESNVVTVKPEQPEIEKYVAKAVHKDIALDEVFEYDIIAYVTKSADSFVITDELVDDLELVGDVTVTDLGTSDNHKVVNDVSGNAVSGNEDATVAKEGTDITDKATITIEDNEIVVSMDDVVSESEGTLVREKDDVLNLRGHWVRVNFSAQIKAALQEQINAGELTVYDLKSVKVTAADVYKPNGTIYKDGDRPLDNVGNAPVISNEDHEGIENTASYVVSVFNEGKYKEASDESNTVTVKPKQPVVPEVAKFDIPVEKNWDEYMNDSSRRPTSITVHLLADGVKLEGKSMTLTEADEWKGIYRDLPRTDKEGNEIKYTLEEEAVDYYYPETVWTDMTYKVINHTRPWIPRLPSTPGNVGYVRVTKTVSGLADKDADYEITVKFTYPHDGGEYTHTLLLNPTSNPSFFFDYIPTGTVVEISEKEGDYTMTCTADKKVTTTFTVEVGKTHEVEINNDKPETPKTPTKTGDGANLLQWLFLIALTAITALLAAYRRKLGQDARK